jgi:membrane carboxypeptidase/penicillin-binding protein
MDYMAEHIKGRTDRPEFSPPSNIVFLRVDRATGAVLEGEAASGGIREAFISGTQPGVGFPRD